MANHSKLISRLTSPVALLLLAATLAAGVALLAYLYLQQREESIRAELAAKSRNKTEKRIAVVVPKADVKANTILNTGNFVSRPVPEDLIYPDTVLAADFSSMEGMKLARPLLRGRPLRLSDLQPPDVQDVASVVPQGRRAMTIDIDNLNSIAQTLMPNHRVDIFLISRAPKPLRGSQQMDDRALEQATLFMQDMVVLATGKEFQDVSGPMAEQTSKMQRPGEVEGTRERSFDSVTLLVSPQQAARLMVGQRLGSYRVVLRGRLDRDTLAMRPLRGSEVMPLGATGADGVELIAGGRGGNIVSQLAVLPSQQDSKATAAFAAATQLLQAVPAAMSSAALPAAPSPANQPVPAMRSRITQ